MNDPYHIDLDWLRQIIIENSEHPCYDFKKGLNFKIKDDKEVESKNRAELVRDIISLANQALLNQKKSYLIIGASRGNITGISKTYDDNDFQVFLNAYITPDLKFLYKQLTIDSKSIGIFIILPDGERIFTIKKAYKFQNRPNLLTKGETWNRRGSSKYNITENQELLQLQKQLTNRLSEKSIETQYVSEKIKQKFWATYLTEIKFIIKDLDFLGFNNLRDEPSVPLQDIFMSIQFGLESEVLQNPVIKERINKFIKTLNAKADDSLNIPIEEDVSQEQLIQIFDKIRKIENSDYHKAMYIQFLFLFRHLLVIGAPGFGKTTFLKFIWLEAEQKAIFSQYNINGKQIPLFISLLEYESYLIEKGNETTVTNSLIDFISSKIKLKTLDDPISTNVYQKIVKDQLKSGNIILLLDGVDEVSNLEYRTQILKEIELFGTIYTNCRIIITSRPLTQLDQLKKIGFFPLIVQPLQLFEINRFIFNWYSSKIHDADTIRKQANSLIQIVQNNSDLLNLASNPLMLTLMVIIHRIEGKIPERRAILYQKTTNTFLETWDQKKGIEIQFSLDLIKKCLNVLAFEIQKRFTQGAGLEISIIEAKRILVHHMVEKERQELIDAGNKVDKILNIFQERSGVLIAKNSIIIFWHSTFKDFFAAQYIKNTYITDLDGLWQLISELIQEEKWILIINLFFGLISELTLEILFNFAERIIKSDNIPFFHKFQVLNDILLENPDTTKHLLPKVFDSALIKLNSTDHDKHLKTKILQHMHPIIELFSPEMIKKLVVHILKDFFDLSTFKIKQQSSNLISEIFDSIYRKHSDLLLAILKENIPEDVLSVAIQSEIETLTDDNLLLLRTMLEIPTLDNKEVLFDYFRFIKCPLFDKNERKYVKITKTHLRCVETFLDSIQECKKVFYPSIFLFFHYLLKKKNISSFIEPFGFFGEFDVDENYHPFRNDLWMILNINFKFRSLLHKIHYKEGITKMVTQIPSRKKFYFSHITKKIPLEPFKPIRIQFDMNPSQKMLDQNEFSFRFRIQMKHHHWFITKKIDFVDRAQLEDFEKKLEIFEQQIKPFNIRILREEEYTIVKQALEYLNSKQIEKVLEFAQKALELDKLFYLALRLKSEALGRLLKFEESNKVNSIIFKNFPKDSWVYYRQALNLARLLRFEDILKIQKNETIADLNDAFFLLYKAEAYSKFGEYQKADSLFLKINSQLRDKIEYQVIQIEHSIRVDDIQKAKQVLSQVNQKEKEIDNLYHIDKLINLNIAVKNSTTANRWLKKAKEMGIIENVVLFYQIKILMEKGKKQKSLKLAERSSKKYPKDLNLLNITGLIHLQLKKMLKARKFFQTTIDLNKNFSSGWYNFACTYALERKQEEALNALTRAIALDPCIRVQALIDDDFESLRHIKEFQELVSKKNKDY